MSTALVATFNCVCFGENWVDDVKPFRLINDGQVTTLSVMVYGIFLLQD